MKVLSLRQPWAWLVANGHKVIETRTWNTKYRGPLLIHASVKMDENCDNIYKAIQELLGPDCPLPAQSKLDLGALVGIVNVDQIGQIGWCCHLADTSASDLQKMHLCVPIENYKWPKWGWYLSMARVFKKPIPCRGMPGLFTPPDDVLEAVAEQIKSAQSA